MTVPPRHTVLAAFLRALICAAGPSADEIMTQAATNQERSEAARSLIVFEQKVLVRMLRGGAPGRCPRRLIETSHRPN